MASFARVWAFHPLKQMSSRGLSRYRGYVEQVMATHGNAKPQQLFSSQLHVHG